MSGRRRGGPRMDGGVRRQPPRRARPRPAAPPAASPPRRAASGRRRAAPRTATRAQRARRCVLGLLAALLFALWLFSRDPDALRAGGAASPISSTRRRRGWSASACAAALGAFLLIFALLALVPAGGAAALPAADRADRRAAAAAAGLCRRHRQRCCARRWSAAQEALRAGRGGRAAARPRGAPGRRRCVTFLGTAVARLIGGGFALFNVFTLVVVTPVVAFYLLRDWPRDVRRVDSWLPRRSAAHAAPIGARHRPRALGLAARAAAVLRWSLAVFYAVGAAAGRARARPDRRADGGHPDLHPLCRLDHRLRLPRCCWRWRSSAPGAGW